MVTAIAALLIAATEEPTVFYLRGRSNGNVFGISLRSEKFRAKGRTLIWVQHPGDMVMPGYLKNGKKTEFLGWDTMSASCYKGVSVLKALVDRGETELASIKVEVDGVKWRIPDDAGEGLLWPNLGSDYVSASLSKRGDQLKLQMSGSDGGGGYSVTWTIHRDGRIKRQIQSDC